MLSFWGLDLSDTLQEAGRVVGLLAILEDGETYLPDYDAMGNLHALMTTASVTLDLSYSVGDIVAAYEYDAYGQTIRETGGYAGYNPFRFSTKYTDNETSLVYYGHRYYSPSLGRFINRDPIEEQGGINLYSFVGNNSINAWDYLGMDAFGATYSGTNPDGTTWTRFIESEDQGDGFSIEGQRASSIKTYEGILNATGMQQAAADAQANFVAVQTAKINAVMATLSAMTSAVMENVTLSNGASLIGGVLNSSYSMMSATSSSVSSNYIGSIAHNTVNTGMGNLSSSNMASAQGAAHLNASAKIGDAVIDNFANLATVEHTVPEYNHERTTAFVNGAPSETSTQYLGRHLGSGFDKAVFRQPGKTGAVMLMDQGKMLAASYALYKAAPYLVRALSRGAQYSKDQALRAYTHPNFSETVNEAVGALARMPSTMPKSAGLKSSALSNTIMFTYDTYKEHSDI